ncbi:BioH [Candidatus Thiomargarita nelsonii]|uniref:Pimeloyl-[acyl-carrier protein] methyl ester esterase n=1 Tax=Candidatus Thiomargarita nelsonii TaxID=1003181 RepID=A0A0A6RHE0_9GAMM|nr:BioH [Candidatus Thiomargarita nelsonii]
MNLFVKQQGEGKPLILLHGFGFNGEIWNDIAAQLAQDWHVYQVDLPGHGRSAMCEYSLPILTEKLAVALPQEAVWVGWSMGGLLAMAMARWHPVRALVLVSSSPRFVTAENWPHAMTSAVLQLFAHQVQSDTLGTLQRFLALQVKGGEDARPQLRALKALLKKTPSPQAEALQGGLQLLQNTDLRSELSLIRCPALLCLGERDTLVPAAMGKDCQQWWPKLQTVCIKRAAHVPFLSHPQVFIELLQGFLNEFIAS